MNANLPSDLAGFRDFHRGETIVVCGCGASLSELREPQRFITIGVNDVGRLFDPTYLVVLNPPSQFKTGRFRYVEESRARAVFTQLDLRLKHPHVVRFRLGRRGGGEDSPAPGTLDYSCNSPYVALMLALRMGAVRIGLIGVDFTDHHFFAPTGRHPLVGRLREIDAEYRKAAETAQRRGIEIVNLGSGSLLTAFPKVHAGEWLDGGAVRPLPSKTARVFFVHYQFLSCGDVFRTGLSGAARELGIESAGAEWNDAALPSKISRFSPDLLFVVHGRRFAQRWGHKFANYRSAVWLLDEPYEVDDTERTSRLFDYVFVNDPSTLGRHRNARYLPVAFDPTMHRPGTAARDYDIGFIGGGNPSREVFLNEFATAGRLSYVVGGPWKSPSLQRLCLERNIPASRTAELYRRTRVILNVFRDKHHFNRRGVAAWSLNPRVYEALACGALVISEDRPEARQEFPAMPVFRTPAEAMDIANDLFARPNEISELLAACRPRLAAHTYAARLESVLQTVFGNSPPGRKQPANATSMNGHTSHAMRPAVNAAPKFAILMAVSGGLEMVRLSTLKTLRHSSGSSARLIVVDNGSSDGTEAWLRMLAERGDIYLIRLEENIGHGPALEKARAASESEYIVTLDSDAFPLSDDWLEQLETRLDESTLAAGIGHHRGYVHPSCLMIARRTLDRLGSTFLNEKHKASRYDVAERLSHDILASGGKLAILERTASQCRGSISEPVYLGSEYGSIIFHQWYTTRHLGANGRQVDDVPRDDFTRALTGTIERFGREPRDLTVVMGLRARPGQPERERNARAALEAFNHQDLERWRYRIVVVEQDSDPRLQKSLGPLADRWIFAKNPGPYNRGWGFNVGASHPERAAGVLCLADADLLAPRDFLRSGLERIRARVKVVLPYSECRHLTQSATERMIRDGLRTAPDDALAKAFEGKSFRNSNGGCLFIDAGAFFEIGGFDERFEGWGAEDREFWSRLTKRYRVEKLNRVLLHLHHERPDESGADARRNQALLARLRKAPPGRPTAQIGCLDRYAADAPPKGSKPNWRCWDSWPIGKIEGVVKRELAAADGTRPLDAKLLEHFGPSVLDLGCGPGAVYARLRARNAAVAWTGADLTGRMLHVARGLFPEAPLVNADGSQMPFRDRSFDAVLLRHVLEHLPEELLGRTIQEVLRVARRIAVIDFFVRPAARRQSMPTSGDYLETRWSEDDIRKPVEAAQGRVLRRQKIERDSELWIIAPAGSDVVAGAVNAAFSQGPKISIVMPTFRRPHVLPRTLDSVRKQTYQNWELVLVDNGGDLTATFDDPRIRIFRHAERASASYARNRGVQHATGDLVCFFDDDDLMFPDYLESFVKAFQRHPRASMVRCGMQAGGKENYSFATPECCLRRQYATPTWDDHGPCQDQRYFKRVVAQNHWQEKRGDIVVIRRTLCRALRAPVGGLRSGRH